MKPPRPRLPTTMSDALSPAASSTAFAGSSGITLRSIVTSGKSDAKPASRSASASTASCDIRVTSSGSIP